MRVDQLRQVLRAFDFLSAQRADYVARLKPGLLRRVGRAAGQVGRAHHEHAAGVQRHADGLPARHKHAALLDAHVDILEGPTAKEREAHLRLPFTERGELHARHRHVPQRLVA